MLINEQDRLEYAVVVEGKIIYKASLNNAENYRDALSPELKEKAEIVPVTSDNKQLLLG